MFDQLLFTWVPRGAAGPGFQPVAATGRLADPRGAATQTAIRYCRYSRPAGPSVAPISFGWANAGPDRIVFRRGHLGRDAGGPPGNFYAHILIGPAERAPVAELAGRFDSAFWWRGEPVAEYGGGLFPVRIADIPPTPLVEVDGEELAAFTDAVFGALGNAPVVLRHEPAVVIGLVGALAGRLPGALEELSVSTYEPLDTAGEYDIVGMGGSLGVPSGAVFVTRNRSCGPALRARRVALSRRPDEQHVAKVALAAVGKAGQAPLAAVVQNLSTFSVLLTGGSVDAAKLPPVLADPGAAAALLRLNAGRFVLVDALVAARAPVWDALEKSAPHLPRRLLDELAAHLGQSGVRSPDPQAVAFVLGRSLPMPEHFTSSLVRSLVGAAALMPDRLAGLDTWSTLTLLRACASAGDDHANVVTALLAGTPDVCLAVSGATDLPASWRARALANRLAAVPERAEPVVTRLDDDPGLVEPFLRAPRTAALLRDALRQSRPAVAARVALHAAEILGDDQLRDLLADTLARLEVGERRQFLERALAGRFHPGWDSIAAAVAGDLIVDQLRQRTGNLPPDPDIRRLLQQVAGPQCDHWLRILDEATEADVALLAATGVDDRHRDAAQRFILARRLATAPGPADLRKVTRQLRAVYGHSDEHIVSLLMDACLACSRSDPPSPLPYVSFVLECIDAGTLVVSRSGQLENRALHRTAQQVVESLGETDRRTASRQALFFGGRANKWWKACRRPAR